jgi:hypothetical protein
LSYAEDVVMSRRGGRSHGTAQNYDSCPSEMHVRQAELNIELFHDATTHRPEDAILIYGLTEDYGRLTLHRVGRRPAIFVEMLGKAAAAFDADNAAAVTAEGVVTKQCVTCPYRSRCAAAQARAIPAAGTGGLDQARLRSIDRLITARQRAVEAEEEAARARRGGSRNRRDADRGWRQQDQAQRLRRAIEVTNGRRSRPRNPLRMKQRTAFGPSGPKPFEGSRDRQSPHQRPGNAPADRRG